MTQFIKIEYTKNERERIRTAKDDDTEMLLQKDES